MIRPLHRFRLWWLHIFHIVSNVHPCYWMGIYVALVPLFAFFYWLMPDEFFRLPDQGGSGYGSWVYYSIVTITTLGFGDYTPALGWAQALTAVEVMCGLLVMGFFLNSVGSMKSEIDVTTELEKQRQVYRAHQRELMIKNVPLLQRLLGTFAADCLALKNAKGEELRSAADAVVGSGARAALMLDSVQTRVDLTLWPDLLDDCFSFVADYQILASELGAKGALEEGGGLRQPLADFVAKDAQTADHIGQLLSQIVLEPADVDPVEMEGD